MVGDSPWPSCGQIADFAAGLAFLTVKIHQCRTLLTSNVVDRI
jgi:hypothetical protein